jgi:hypothetical protein
MAMMWREPRIERRCRPAVLPMLCLLLASAGCATTVAPAPPASTGEAVGEVSSSGKVTNRLFRLRVIFEDGTEETLQLREGQTVTYRQPDGTYRLTPRVSKQEIGKVEVEVERNDGRTVQPATVVMSVGEEKDFAHEFRQLGWPALLVKVVRVQPPIRRGPNPISDY